MKMSILCLGVLLFNLWSFSLTEDTTVNIKPEDMPKVYLDCFLCDENYIKTEITYVNYVRDPNIADVFILVTTLSTASAGTEYTLTFYGKNRFAGMNDTLVFISKPNETPDNVREKLTHYIKIGLSRYAVKTSVGEYLQVNYNRPVATPKIVDKWNNWVFSIYANSNFNGEKSYKNTYWNGGVSASRVTHEWKIQNTLSMSYNESEYDYEIVKFLNVLRGYELESMIVKSLTDHTSTGGYFEIASSTFENNKISVSVSPAFEYNFFPYREFTRKQLRLMYRVSYKHIKYHEETLYDKNLENLFRNSLSLTFDLQQPWGSISTTVSGSAYLHDFKKRRITFYSNLSLRVFEGLSLNLYASYSRISDQLSIPKAGATPEEVLLRRKQLSTNYSYYGYVGLSYTFGSIYQNIVNPRFGGTGTRMIYISY